MAICAFCREREAESLEHVVLNGFGGKKKAHRLSCQTCNNVLGGDIDAVIQSKFIHFARIAGCYRGDGDPVGPADFRDAETNERLSVSHGALEVRRENEVTLTISYPTGVSQDKIFRTRSEDAIAGFIAGQARNLPDGIDTAYLSATTKTSPQTNTFLSERVFGESSEFRSVAKMGLAVQAYGKGLVRGSALEQVGRWVRTGADSWDHAMDASAGDTLRTALGTDIGTHLLAVTPAKDGLWEVIFAAFGAVPYRVRLPSPSPVFAPVVHVVDPIRRTHDVRELRALDLRLLEEARRSPGDVATANARLNEWVHAAAKTARERAAVSERKINLDLVAEKVHAHLAKRGKPRSP